MHPPITALLVALLTLASGAISARERLSEEVTLTQIAEGDAAGTGTLETFQRETLAPESVSRAIFPGEVLGEQVTLVSLVHITNDPSTPYTATDVESSIFDDTDPDSAASFVLEASYGRAWLSESVQAVTGQLAAGYDDTSCLVRTPDGTQDLIDALDTSIDFTAVERWIVIIPQNANCGFAGISSLGKWTFDTNEGVRSFSRVVLNGPAVPFSDLVIHELGHSFAGLQHSEDWECGAATVGTGCTATGTDRYDLMAASLNEGHFTPSGKQALEWFDTQLVDVTGAGGTFFLEPYETTGPGTKALRIRALGGYDDYRELDDYWVSYRKPLGFDTPFTELATDGAMLHLGTRYFPEFSTSATGPSLLLDAKPGSAVPQDADSADVLLEVGQTFTDAGRGITIETIGTSGSALEVEITITQYCGNGVLDAANGEACDGTDLGTATCTNRGFTSGTLACDASCDFDVTQCGPAVCAAGDTYDEGADLCTASFPSSLGPDMSVYRNYVDWSLARTITTATLLTTSRGSFGTVQNFDGIRSVITRLLLPFDTSALPDGAVLDSASLTLKHDVQWDPYVNTHPAEADQLVLVQTTDPTPAVREKSDYGVFTPVDAPAEGAPRIDAGDTYTPGGQFTFDLNATGLAWIDDTGTTKLGLRTGYDVDDVFFPAPTMAELKLPFVPSDSPISGPRLEVTYHPMPEPGTAAMLLAGAGLLAGLSRRRAGRSLAKGPRRPMRFSALPPPSLRS